MRLKFHLYEDKAAFAVLRVDMRKGKQLLVLCRTQEEADKVIDVCKLEGVTYHHHMKGGFDDKMNECQTDAYDIGKFQVSIFTNNEVTRETAIAMARDKIIETPVIHRVYLFAGDMGEGTLTPPRALIISCVEWVTIIERQ